MTKNQANAIYDILVEHCGAPPGEHSRIPFVDSIRRGCREYRCCHALGFGGKFWDANGKWYVNAYNDEMTPEWEQIIERTNKLLSALKARPVIGITATGKLRQWKGSEKNLVPFKFTVAMTDRLVVEQMVRGLGCGIDDQGVPVSTEILTDHGYTLEEETIL